MSEDHKKLRLASGKAVAKAWRDPEFRDLLIKDPAAALSSMGFEVPQGISIRVLEDSDQITHHVQRLDN